MEIKHLLENTLRKEPNFLTDNGNIKKWVVISKAQNFDKTLISLLLKEPRLKTEFFREIENHWFFDQNRFADFIEQKEYLEDSFTRYKNKIGLTIGNKYLHQRNEVSLVWPYKDCILEGGQSREEQKRNEIFFNELLAQDEITQLLEPKVLTNAKHFTFNSEKTFQKFNRNEQGTITDNLLIKGNNLLAIHSLKKEFVGKVKLIYIDPPYNTENGSFTYNDSFNHSTWLTFMKNRLEIAYKLMSEKGVIFISCDDNEQPYLKVLCDEVFKREHFLACLPTIMNLKGNNDQFGFAGTHEYTLVYAKNKKEVSIYEFDVNDEDLDDWEEDSIGFYKKGANLKATGGNAPREKRANLFYPILINPKSHSIHTIEQSEFEQIYDKNNKEFNDPFLSVLRSKYENKGFIFILPVTNNQNMSWRWQLSKIRNEPNNIIIIGESNDFSIYKKQRPTLGELPSKKPKTLFYKPEYSSGNGTAQIKAFFGEKAFKNPKPTELIKDFIKITTDNNSIILDFMGGSGTTAQAVLDLNKEDGGKRQFILCEQMNYVENVTAKRIQKVIEKNEEGSFIYLELKKYNETFIEQIQEATTNQDLLQIWEAMKEHSFLNYNIDIKAQDTHIEEFKALSIEDQKQHLVAILDKNQLYVPLSAMNNAQYSVTEEEKNLTKAFYKL